MSSCVKRQGKSLIALLLSCLIFIAGLPLNMIDAKADIVHPFLICTSEDFPELRAKANTEPYKSMKADALSTVNKGLDMSSSDKRVKCCNFSQYITAAALLYILDEPNKTKYASIVENTILTSVDKLPSINNGEWNSIVLPATSLFSAILSLDIVYNDVDVSACESKLSTWINKINRSGSWETARYGLFGTWDIYRGVRTTPDDTYYNNIMKNISADGVATTGAGYGFARMSKEDRYVKTLYMDVLEHTGIDKRYYNNKRLQNYYEWLYGLSVSPAHRSIPFGDTAFLQEDLTNQDEPIYRAGNFSEKAAEYASWYSQGNKPRGNIINYIIPENPLPTTEVKFQSRYFKSGGAWFRDQENSKYAVMGAMWNVTSTIEHQHKDINAIYAAAYGEHTMLNSGYTGWKKGAAGYDWNWISSTAASSNTLTIDSKNHNSVVGGGITEGLTTETLDYAVGNDGAALSANHNRSFLYVHPHDGTNGYFLLFDEVSSASGSEVVTYLHPNTKSSTGISTVTDKQEYIATINGYLADSKNTDVRQTIFYATPTKAVTQQNGGIAGWSGKSFESKYLKATYELPSSGKKNIVTVLFPSDSTHSKAAMSRILGTGYTGAVINHGNRVIDYAIESDASSVISNNGASFKSKATLFRKNGNNITSYFIRSGSKFSNSETTNTFGFESNKNVTVYMNGNEGKVVSEGAQITFFYPGVTGVYVNGELRPISGSGDGWITLSVPSGTADIFIATDGVVPPTDPDAPDVSDPTVPSTTYVEKLVVKEDAFVKNGTYVDTNFGSEKTIDTKEDEPPYDRRSVLKFDISSLRDKDIKSINLALTVNSTGKDAYRTVGVYETSNDWSESTVTWNTLPVKGSKLGSFEADTTVGVTYKIDVTDYVLSNLDKDEVSLMLWPDSKSDYSQILFYSKEAYENEPCLLVECEREYVSGPVDPLPSQSGKIVVLEDSHTRHGSYGDNNYGTSTDLELKQDRDDYHRRVLLKFDLSGYKDKDVDSAQLCITVKSVGTDSSRTVGVYQVDSNWSESAVTWNTMPSRGEKIGSFVADTSIGTTYTVDITDYLKNNLGSDTLSIMLYPETSGGQKQVVFYSKDSGQNEPYIQIECESDAPKYDSLVISLSNPVVGANKAVTFNAYINNYTADKYEGNLIIGMYNENDALVEIKIVSLPFNSMQKNTVPTSFKIEEGTSGCKIKAFVWNDSMEDISNIAEYQFDN